MFIKKKKKKNSILVVMIEEQKENNEEEKNSFDDGHQFHLWARIENVHQHNQTYECIVYLCGGEAE